MPILPAPFTFLPSGGGVPVSSTADVLATYPERVRNEPVAPVRDAIVEMQTEIFIAYQSGSAYAAAQSDPTRSTGVYLEEDAAEVGVFRQEDEEDEALRNRLFAPPAIVTPVNIKAAVNAVLAPYTATECIVWDSVLDRLYVGDGTTTWAAFVGDGLVEMTPDYPDRRYALRGACTPGGAFTFSDGTGRFFIVRVPDLSESDTEAAYVIAPNDGANNWELYPTTGVLTYPAYLFSGAASADAAYATIVNAVDSIRGHGVRWTLIVDPKL